MKILFTFLFIPISIFVHSQNLIPNPGFEDVNICEVYKEECSPKAWRNVILKGFRFPEVAMLSASRENIRPKEGLRAAIIPLYHKKRKNDRIFIQVPFLCELEKDSIYEFSFHYLLTEETTQSIGLVFSDSLMIRDDIDDLIGMKPDVEIILNKELKYKKWVEYKIAYKAKGGEQGLILGNFMEDKDIEYTPLVKLKKNSHYPRRLMIWLDDFNLSPIYFNNDLCDLELNKEKIYKDSIRHYVKEIIMERKIKRDLIIEKNKLEIIKEEEHDYGIIEEEIVKIPEEINEPALIKNKIVAHQSFVLDNINFESNSAKLLASSYTSLNRLLQYLEENPDYQLKIIGHTDNVGSDSNNMKLSRRRAESVAAYFIEKGISPARIYSLGKGEIKPIDTNDTEEGRSNNRRVEFIME